MDPDAVEALSEHSLYLTLTGFRSVEFNSHINGMIKYGMLEIKKN